MNVFLIMIVLQTASSYTYIPKEKKPLSYQSKPINPRATATIADLPHHVLVAYEGFFCSGSLIRSQVVVTAASCFDRGGPQYKTVIKVGANTVVSQGQVIEVIEIKIHEYYKHFGEVNNDIALLALKEHVTFNENVKKILLVDPEVSLRVGTTIDVSSWGHVNLPQKFLNQLVWSEMVVQDNADCQKHYGALITPSNFCAKYQIDRRVSDNGGPAVYDNFLVGILSFGGIKRDEPHLAVFTNVSYFNRWIMLNCRRFMEKYCVEEDVKSESFEYEK